jgi:sec-independent protein translocase protein TatA
VPYHSRVMPNIGPLEIAIVLVIVLIIFGPKRLPELGKSMGEGIRGFRGAMAGEKDEDDATTKKSELQPPKEPSAAAPTPDGPAAEGEEPAVEVITENKG